MGDCGKDLVYSVNRSKFPAARSSDVSRVEGFDHHSCGATVRYKWERNDGKGLAASRPMTRSRKLDKRNASNVFDKCLSKRVVPVFMFASEVFKDAKGR